MNAEADPLGRATGGLKGLSDPIRRWMRPEPGRPGDLGLFPPGTVARRVNGEAGWRALATDPLLSSVPWILETPGDAERQRADIAHLRTLAGRSRHGT